jgi:hypothetical protein
MSLGYDYDMILLPPETPSDSDFSPRRWRCGRRSGHHGHRSHRAHHARQIRGSPHPSSGTGGKSPNSSESSCSAAVVGSLTRDLSRIGLTTDEVPMAQGTTARRHVEEPPCYTGSASVARGPVAALSSFPYGLDNASTIHSRSMRPAMSSCVGLPEYRLLSHPFNDQMECILLCVPRDQSHIS